MLILYICKFDNIKIIVLKIKTFKIFLGDGRKLVSIGLDNDHSVALWDWKKGVKLATSNGHKDKIFMIRFDPIDSNRLVTVGVKHIKFWQHVG